MFGQTFQGHDLAIVGLLIVLEGVLSIDNALVLGILAKRLPKHQQARALTYGLVGAFVFRIIAIGFASLLLEWRVAKLLGGAYLIYIAAKHFLVDMHQTHDHHVHADEQGHPQLTNGHGHPLGPECEEAELESRTPIPVSDKSIGAGRRLAKFWPTVVVIELTDIAFAVDSILAAIAMISTVPKPEGQQFHPKLWVVVTGGMLGVILMRFAAIVFIKLLERFPRFEVAAYVLVVIIGLKLCLDFFFNKDPNHPVLDFHHPMHHGGPNWAFWGFWAAMVAAFCVGFLPKKQAPPVASTLRV